MKPKPMTSVLLMVVILFFAVYFMFQNAYYFIVEKGFPLIHYRNVSPNYALLIGIMALSVISIYLLLKVNRKKDS